MACNQLVLKDNTAHYCLYPDLTLIQDDPGKLKDHLRDYVIDYFSKLSDLLKDYIWQHEDFNLHPVQPSTSSSSSSNLVGHIEGTTCFEDNVEDEWFIVYLLIKLTQLDSKLVASIEDSDGQFLLIEAADHLPKWVTPENSINRVFLYNGELHLIPPKVLKSIDGGDVNGAGQQQPIRIQDALRVVRDESIPTLCTSQAQVAIRRRIAVFPEQINGQKHRAQCFVPAGVATLLNYQPSLISPAVRAFYHRDALDMKACRLMKYFPPENRVKRNVTFTKCLYAQTIGQQFQPDPKIGWNIPPKESPLFKSYDLGMKIACGFEILVNRCKKVQNGAHGEEVNEENCTERRWLKLVQSLEDKGYFKGFMKGSRKWKDLLHQAYSFYRNSMDFTEDRLTTEEEIGSRILDLLKSVTVDFDRLKREEKSLEPEDSDDWMNIDQKRLDEILENQFSNGADLNANLVKMIPEALKSFVNYSDSGIEGAEFPDNNNWKPSSGEKIEPIKFDEDAFGDALKNILAFKLPSTETSSSSSAMSDYEMESDGREDEDSLDSDDDEDISNHHSEITPAKRVVIKKTSKAKTKEYMEEVKQYMEAMDKELAKTEVGRSFERVPVNGSSTTHGPPLATCDEDSDDDETLPPVDSDLTALKNILDSFDSQKGLPGPGSNILSSMGVHIPRDAASRES